MDTRRRASVSPQHFAVDRTAIIAASKQAAPRILTGPVVVAAAEPATVIATSVAGHSMNQGGTRVVVFFQSQIIGIVLEIWSK